MADELILINNSSFCLLENIRDNYLLWRKRIFSILQFCHLFKTISSVFII